jgi:tmRNA-binding protein
VPACVCIHVLTFVPLALSFLSFNPFFIQERRKRRLLVSKKEILKIKSKQEEQGLTLVPVKMYFRGPW